MEDIKQENYQTNNEVIQLLEHSYNNIYQYQVCADVKQVYPDTFESEKGHGTWFHWHLTLIGLNANG